MTLLLSLADSARFTPASLPDLALWLDPTYGVYKDGAASFNGSASYLQTTSAGFINGLVGSPFTVALWLYDAGSSSGQRAIFSGAGYFVDLSFIGGNQFQTQTLDSGGNVRGKSGAIPPNTWTHIAWGWDGTAYSLHVNGAAVGSPVTGSGVFPGLNPDFTLGASDTGAVPMVGRQDSVCVYSVAPAAVASMLYNAGAGKSYSDLSAAEKTGLLSWLDLDETTGTRFDKHGSVNLAMTGTVGWAAGIVSSVAADNDPVSRWVARTGQVVTPPSLAVRPTYKTNSGKPYLSYDGVDDCLLGTISPSLFPAAGSLVVRFRDDNPTAATDLALLATSTNGNDQVTRYSVDQLGYPQQLRNTRLAGVGAIGTGYGTLVSRSSSAAFTQRYNGTQIVSTTGDYSAGDGLWQIGKEGSRYLKGGLADIVAYGRYITDAEALQLETHVAGRFG